MHRLLMGVTDPKILVDHRDGNGLNNRRSNIRLASPMNNQQNRQYSWSSSGMKGVQLLKSGAYMAGIRFHKKQIYLGYFKTLEDAARAYNAKAAELFGEFAYLNPV